MNTPIVRGHWLPWLILVFGSWWGGAAERQYFVSASAAAGGDGSAVRPFRELIQARDAIRHARKSGALPGDAKVVVRIAAGVYVLENTWELTTEDSGTPGNPVVYKAEGPGLARVQGGRTLRPADFKPVTNHLILNRLPATARQRVLVCDLSSITSAAFPEWKPAFKGTPPGPWLYINGHPMTLARWPNVEATNGGWAKFSKAVDTGLPKPDAQDPVMRKQRPGAFVFDYPRMAQWKMEEGVWLQGYWTHDWADEVLRMGSYDAEAKVVRLAAPHHYGIAAGTWGASHRRFYAMNLLEELDSPGEWYLDRARKQLYLWPPAGWPKAEVVLALLAQPLLRLKETRHLQIIGLAFEYGHGDGIVLQDTEQVELAGCRVANLGGSGIQIQGRQNTVRSCDLFNLGRSGISLNGGDRARLIPANNLAYNNHIHHYGLFQRTYAPGIGANGCGQVARNNRIHDAPHNAVLYGGNEHLFELNEIYRVVMETGDAGAFYTGRDWTSQGNILRHNYIHDLGVGDTGHVNTMGVYLDDCDSGDTLEGNVFFRAGRAIMIGGGRDNTVLNNLVVNCPIGLHLDSRGTTWRQWNNPAEPGWHLEGKAQQLNYTQPPWSERYPRLARIMQEEPQWPLGNVIRRNVFVDCTQRLCDFDGNVRKILERLDIADNLAVNTRGAGNIAMAKNLKGFRDVMGTAAAPVDLGFRNAAAGDFSLTPQARLYGELPAFQPIPFERIGLVVDEYRRTLPPR
jgi:parallel beta-helix repeat protein